MYKLALQLPVQEKRKNPMTRRAYLIIQYFFRLKGYDHSIEFIKKQFTNDKVENNSIIVWDCEDHIEIYGEKRRLLNSILNLNSTSKSYDALILTEDETVVKLKNERKKISDSDLTRKFSSLETSALSRDIRFNMSLTHLRRLMNTKYCYYTGIELSEDNNSPNKRTVDQVLAAKGYTDNNTVVCTKRINELKRDMTPEDIEALHKGLQKFKKRKNSIL